MANLKAFPKNQKKDREFWYAVGSKQKVYNSDNEVIIVSSGAVACGRSLIHENKEELDSLDQRQLFSAVGQAKLIDLYYTLFREHGITVGQVLTTKESLSGKKQMANVVP